MAESSKRLRLLTAAVAALALSGLVAVVLVLSGGSGVEHSFDPAPERCLAAWNDDQRAIGLGRHQFGTHGYSEVQVLTLGPGLSEPAPPEQPGASCAVIFAADTLDLEIDAAASVRMRNGWEPLSGHQPPEELAVLQEEAGRAYNAELDADGSISPLG